MLKKEHEFETLKKGIYSLSIAFLVSLAWMLIAKDKYEYKHNFTFFWINLYPLFSWTLGLFFLYLIYLHFKNRLKKQTFAKKLGIFVGFYWPLLVLAETVAYHIFNIKNLAAVSYKGIPFCDCIHAPLWVQISYFLIGIVFFLICFLLKLDESKKNQ
jgi:hypothetical protein